jgi:hypothetical protein
MKTPIGLLLADLIRSVLLIIGLIGIVSGPGCGRAVEQPWPAQWSKLDQELFSLQQAMPSDILSYEQLRRSPTFDRLASRAQVGDCLAMVEQDEYLFVKVAGFRAIESRFPEKAFEGALRLFLTARRPLTPLNAPVATYLMQAANTEANRAALGVLDDVSKERLENREWLILGPIPYDLLFDWFSEKHGAIHEATLVLVVTRLYQDARKQKRTPTAIMAKNLDRCWSYPGPPRLAYLCFADSGDGAFLPRLREYLSDEAVADNHLTFLLRRRRNDVVRSVDIDSLRTSATRRALIRSELSKPAGGGVVPPRKVSRVLMAPPVQRAG